MRYNWKDFCFLGLTLATNTSYIDRVQDPNPNQDRIFRSQFGISWFVCEDVWMMLNGHWPNSKREPKHLLWALLFMKVYRNEATCCRLVGTSIKTYRKWVWELLDAVADLKDMVVSTWEFQLVERNSIQDFILTFFSFFYKIVWENRKNGDIGNDCLVSVDGVDFEIEEPYPYEREWSRRWFSPKFKGPGLRYEVG